jgi:Uma2 family endonuclease
MLQCAEMTLTASPHVAVPATRRFNNAAELQPALWGIPLHRIIMNPAPGTATEADLLRLVERDKRLCELIDGTLVEKPVGMFESRIAANLIAELTPYVNRNDLGGVSGEASTLRMSSTGRIRLPDVAFISKARDPTTWIAVPTLAPDLAVEVLSESNTKEEIDQKLREYFASGTRLAWIIDPRGRTVAVYHGPDLPTVILQETDMLDGEQVIPGFSMPISMLFNRVPRFQS